MTEKKAASDNSVQERGVTAKGVEAWVIEGNRRFRSDPGNIARIEMTKSGQHPKRAVAGCGDSRVAANNTNSASIGDQFNTQAIAAMLDNAGIAALMYPVLHLGTRVVDIEVHTGCGGIAAAIQFIKTGKLPDAEKDSILNQEVRRIASVLSATPSALDDPTAASILVGSEVAKRFAGCSSEIREMAKSGELGINVWLYDIKTGEKHVVGRVAYDGRSDSFVVVRV